ncbi:MAG: 3-dehydroquinate synthase [Dehalococcoidales bacterium]|nr:3-dehydroquinate synthase [Dehalococcoidales bacterium]
MKKVTLDTGRTSYNILTGIDLLEQAGGLLREAGISGTKAVVISDTKVYDLHGEVLKSSLTGSGFDVLIIKVPQGEEQKSLDTAGRIYTKLTDFYAERTTPLLALGGGVIGDLTGFVAATYMRGTPLVQLPTTLLSMGDSSIGGKTAVNHGQLKNKIGVFYHPWLTVSDISTLKTLTERELSNGLSEIIKHGVILDAEFFSYLERNIGKIKALDDEVMETIVSRSAEIKARIVEQDELDMGLRNILNCGHTVGHAIESVSGLQVWHGEAVATGLLIEAGISNLLGLMSSEEVDRIKLLMTTAGLPIELPGMDPVKIIDAMKHDKKVVDGKIRFALPQRIGKAVIRDDISNTVIEKALVS